MSQNQRLPWTTCMLEDPFQDRRKKQWRTFGNLVVHIYIYHSRKNVMQRPCFMNFLASTKRVKDLLRVPLSPERVLSSVLVIVLDLSTPGNVVPSLTMWITLLRNVIADVLAQRGKCSTSPSEALAIEKLKDEAMARYGASHPDKRDVRPVPIPLLIVGAKYETFRNEDRYDDFIRLYRQWICRPYSIVFFYI
jgi:hypothetical protein